MGCLCQNMINNDQSTLLLYCCEDVKSHRSGGDTVPLRSFTLLKIIRSKYCLRKKILQCKHSSNTELTLKKISLQRKKSMNLLHHIPHRSPRPRVASLHLTPPILFHSIPLPPTSPTLLYPTLSDHSIFHIMLPHPNHYFSL